MFLKKTHKKTPIIRKHQTDPKHGKGSGAIFFQCHKRQEKAVEMFQVKESKRYDS